MRSTRAPHAPDAAAPEPERPAGERAAPKDPETWMWERARAMLEQAERLHRGLLQPGAPGGRRPSWEPPADVFETPDEILVVVALPGVEPERVRVEVQDSGILVTGERSLPPLCRQADVRRLEIPHGLFARRVELPPGMYEVKQNQLVHGCLLLNLAKLPEKT